MESQREADRDETASAAASAPAVSATDAPGAVLGRYRIERELGAGAVGAVYAAFDPDLERRVALKVLRRAAASDHARQRLLREARAMARLTHPNVVTVHEAGTAAGRDFIAMELIHGETLADWLRAARRSPAAILDAFFAAGRGLAAAHAAGIIHRDFKPRNVLRSRDGRVAVTDFGLARGTDGDLPVELDDTLPAGAASRPRSGWPEITETGGLVGTPAYMAPEQWRGGAITPETDQFAFCVALWEALAGERPYRGQSLDELRRRIAAGPAALDASRIPRRLRGLLRRGLAPDPARRWPSMNALLKQLERVRRVRFATILTATIGATVATLAVAAAAYAVRGGEPATVACRPPAGDVATVWSGDIAAELRSRTSNAHVAVLDAAYRDWTFARVAACHAATQVRPEQLQCLDGVLRRFDALRQAHQRVPDAAAEELQAQLVDPEVCRQPTADRVPRLTLRPTADVIAAFELLARSSTRARPGDRELAALTEAATSPCARIIATLAFTGASRDVSRARALMSAAISAADQCGDDRLRADLLIHDMRYHWHLPAFGPEDVAALDRAQNAAARVMQPELAAAIAARRRIMAGLQGQWTAAFQFAEAEIADYRARGLQLRQLRAVIARSSLRLMRSEPDDLAAIATDVESWRPLAAASHRAEFVRQLDVLAATARYWLGDVSTAHVDLLHLWRSQPAVEPVPGSREIAGEVVDSSGHPAAGATVAASLALRGDAAGIALPMLESYTEFVDPALRMGRSDASGHFVLEDVLPGAMIVAELGDRRSRSVEAAEHVRLVLEPTRAITGKVDLAGMPYTRVRVTCAEHGYGARGLALVAPVAPDGSFVIAGAPTTALQIGAAVRGNTEFDQYIEYQTVPASSASRTGIRLGVMSSARTLDVVVHSTVMVALDGVSVFVLPGNRSARTIGDLSRSMTPGIQEHPAMPVAHSRMPGTRFDRSQPGDFVAHIPHVPLGDVTVCAISWAGDPIDGAANLRLRAHFSQFAVSCKHLGPGEGSVELDAPPQRRF